MLRKLFNVFINVFIAPLIIGLLSNASYAATAAWTDPSPHQEKFVTVNGVRLQYLDWGGTGPALIFIHGVLDNPHYFDDIAPAFTDRFHVIAYARRGHGRSEAKPPYDGATLTEDLRGLMDQLGIAKADLVGWSMGGNEITAMAGKYPLRVGRLVYFDGAFDWADPESKASGEGMPAGLVAKPASAMTSLDAYRAYLKATRYATLDDMKRVEAAIRASVIVQPDGSVKRRIPPDVVEAFTHTLFTDRRDYTRVRTPALALYAESMFDLTTADVKRRQDALAWEQKYRTPFRAHSVARIRKEIRGTVEVIDIPGSHVNFFVTSRDRVVDAMRRFLQKPH